MQANTLKRFVVSGKFQVNTHTENIRKYTREAYWNID
jgi:hypothetical protein